MIIFSLSLSSSSRFHLFIYSLTLVIHNRDFCFFSGTILHSRNSQNTIAINIKRYFNLRNSFQYMRQSCKNKRAEFIIILCEGTLSLVYVYFDFALEVFVCGKGLGCMDRNLLNEIY